MATLLPNLALLALWAGLHLGTARWLSEAWLRDEGQLHFVLALVGAGWILATVSPRTLAAALGRPLRASLPAAALTIAPIVVAHLGPDLNAVRASLALLSGWGLFGLFVTGATWRASAGPALLLAALLPITGHLDVLLGYPLRHLLAGTVASLTGAADTGTVLAIDGRLAHVDLPCSGVRGLWSAVVLLLAATVVWRRRLGMVTALAIAVALVLQVLQNLFRVTVLVAVAPLDPLVADVVHTPLGVVGFALALAGPVAWVGVAPGTTSPRDLPRSSSPWLAPALAAALLAVPWLPRPTVAAPLPSPMVSAPAPWQPLTVGSAEAAFVAEHGGQLTKAEHPSGAQVAMVSSRSWLAHHVPEQCHEAGGWTLHDDHAAPIGERLVRIASASKHGQEATALWWFRSAEKSTDDHTVRIRAGWTDDAPWVLVSVLLPGHADPTDPALATLVADLDLAAASALETP